MPEEPRVHGDLMGTPEPAYNIKAVGKGTLFLATLLFAYAIWNGQYFFAMGVVLTEIMIIVWVQQGPSIAKLIHWVITFIVLLGAAWYIFFRAPDAFLLIDEHVIPLLRNDGAPATPGRL